MYRIKWPYVLTVVFLSSFGEMHKIPTYLSKNHQETQFEIQGPHGPIFTLPSPPPIPPPSVIGYTLPNAPFLNPLVPPQYMMPRQATSLSSRADGARRLRDREPGRRKHHRTKKRKRSTPSTAEPRPVTEEDVARTYTGLDREIAEEFIAIAMEPGTGKTKHPPVD